jgi:hypothetical protein
MNNPRAIYFNDTVSVGYIRGAGLIEVVAQDAKMGSIFYTVREEPRNRRPSAAISSVFAVTSPGTRSACLDGAC